MVKFIVEKNQKSLISYIQSKYKNLSAGSIYKALRNKDIRVNNEKITENVSISKGDEITLYIKDELLFGVSQIKKEQIIYDDENIVIIDKPQGVLVESSKDEIGLDKLINDYFGVKSIMPCHRLDRNTSGLIIFAKKDDAKNAMLQMIKNHHIRKFYRCTVYGHPKNKRMTLKAYLFKDSKASNVIISDEKKKGYVEITTKYEVISYNDDNTSTLEIELVTGKTHQIRAHLAHIGYPIVGDGKYGINEINKKLKKSKQELKSYKIIFEEAMPPLEYLKNKEIKIK